MHSKTNQKVKKKCFISTSNNLNFSKTVKDFNIGQRGEGVVKDWNFSAHIYIKENLIFQVKKERKTNYFYNLIFYGNTSVVKLR